MSLDIKKLPGFTPAALIKWMQSNKDRKLICGNEEMCVLAQFAADTLLREGEKFASVDGEYIAFYEKRDDMEQTRLYGLPGWAERVVSVFDAAPGRVAGTVHGQRDAIVRPRDVRAAIECAIETGYPDFYADGCWDDIEERR